MLMPKRVKYRRVQKGRMRGVSKAGTMIVYGDYALVATSTSWITANQIESARVAINRYIKRGGKLHIKIFPHKSVTKKPAEVRMGSGKGAPEYFVAVVKPGRILFELSGVSEELAKEAMRLASHKLPVKTKFLTRKDFERVGGE
ncbi:50S ribosomal protein L16 [Candidatus Arthromitus sp. SFB-rat-Yit]|uniref:50S ribosomal protein L16 n=1 Tax=Candidatus Arthromitus sp. SFB-rat-Yit TaxID=1041504 RepID=UPI000227A807|nr:50S ribosomal protein L16 [Candidatus Arthromitus sp. SFB-rat-Yit]BAK81780.1 50S ribosomal protein L16 [Candidatus Arthromitus sp. SFB-rat-Yit]